MTTNPIAELVTNDAPWATHPDRPCNPPDTSNPTAIRAHADRWFLTDKWAAKAARDLCAGCPVATECLAYALAHPEVEGVWAGTTEQDRRRLRKGGDAA